MKKISWLIVLNFLFVAACSQNITVSLNGNWQFKQKDSDYLNFSSGGKWWQEVLLSALRKLGVPAPGMSEPVLGGGEPVGEVRAAW